MRTIIITIALFLSLSSSFAQTKFQKDFAYYWQTVHENFAYFDKQHTNWEKVKQIFQPAVDTITTRNGLIHLLETTNNELYNGHVFLNTNTNSSNRPIPTGADLKLSFIANKFMIAEVRKNYNADLCGLRKGMIVTKFNDVPIQAAVSTILLRSVVKFDSEMYDYAGTFLLAGTHDKKRKITIELGGQEQDFYPDTILNKTEINDSTLLAAKLIPGNIGYIRINNSLGNADLIKAFDLALDKLMNTGGLILDLRETPSGGTTTIARAIMGRFIDKELPYQKHIYTSEEIETGIKRSTLELVSPRQKTYSKKLVILVGYWTGSMAEGIAIGFDGMKRAKIVGTKMAGLLGEIYSFETPETKIPFSFPCVKLQHVNGQPRENFIPNIVVTNQNQTLKIATGLLTKRQQE